MNKADFIEVVQERCFANGYEATKASASAATDAVIEALVQVLADGDTIHFPQLGKFSVREQAAKTIKVFGEEKSIPAKSVPKFAASASLKEAVA